MNPHHRLPQFLLSAMAASLLLAGCGNQTTIEKAQSRLLQLESQGVPDSLLSDVRVSLLQAAAGKRSGNGVLVRESLNSAQAQLILAEEWIAENTASSQALVTARRSGFDSTIRRLTGLQRREADSLLGLVDSFVSQGWHLQARDRVLELDSLLPSLLENETMAVTATAALPGTWTMTRKHDAYEGTDAVERKTISFKGDGSFSMEESMKGQTSPSLREDWLFRSGGTYTLKGDTILLFVLTENCVRQTFWNLKEKNGRDSWVKNSKEPYEKEISDHSKDQFLTFEYVKENFRKTR